MGGVGTTSASGWPASAESRIAVPDTRLPARRPICPVLLDLVCHSDERVQSIAVRVWHTEQMAEGPTHHPWEDWVWDETVFEGTATYYRQGRKPYAPALADALAEHLHLDGRGHLLDVGCGPGTIALLFAHLFEEVVGLDSDSGMVAEAQRAAVEGRIINASWLQLRAEDLPGRLSTFRVISFGQSFHWMDRPRVASGVREMLDASGVVVQVDLWHTNPPNQVPPSGPYPQSPRQPSMSCVAAGSVPTAAPVKGSATPRPMGRTPCSRPPGSPPKNS